MIESSWEELAQCGGVGGQGRAFSGLKVEPGAQEVEGGGWEASHPHLSHICVCKVE